MKKTAGGLIGAVWGCCATMFHDFLIFFFPLKIYIHFIFLNSFDVFILKIFFLK